MAVNAVRDKVTSLIKKNTTYSNRTCCRLAIAFMAVVLIFAACVGIEPTYAFFSQSVTTGVNTIRVANYGCTVQLNDEAPEPVLMSNSEGYTLTFTENAIGESHTVKLQLVDGPDMVTEGYCVITVEEMKEAQPKMLLKALSAAPDEPEGVTTYYTSVNEDGFVNFTLNIYCACKVTFKSHWGTADFSSDEPGGESGGEPGEQGDVNVPIEISTNGTINCGTQQGTPNTFTTVFEHTDTYLYRIGNANVVTLGSLFKINTEGDAAVNSKQVKIKVEALENGTTVSGTGTNLAEGSTAKCVYTTNESDWTQSALKFTGEGPVKVTICEGTGEEYGLNLEIVAATNVTQYSGLANRNSVLLNNITMSSGGKYYLSNATLYGNGFTFDVTAGAHGDTANGNESGNYVIGLINANLDNVQVIGKVYTTYGGTTKTDYNFPCVLVNGGDCVIANSYISNCASPIRARGGANLLLKNTTLKGGSFCNLDIRGGVHLTVDGLTTINQVNGNDAADNGTVIVGLGVVFWYEGANGSETIMIRGDGIKQYNYVASDQSDHAVSTAKTVYSNVFGIDSKFKYNDGTRNWANTGILSLYTDVGEDNITQPNGYAWENVSLLGQSGHLCTQLAVNFPGTLPTTVPEYAPDAQYPIAPTATFELPTGSGKKNYMAKTDGSDDYCYYDSTQGKILIGFEKGDNFSFNPQILTVNKYGKTVTSSVSMNGTPCSGNISFTESGDYTITYTYTDPYNYGSGGSQNQNVTYTKTVEVTAIAADKTIAPATFDFNGWGYKQVTGTNGNTYVMPNVDDSAVDGLNFVKKTVGGKTVYYPVVCVRSGSPSTTTSFNMSALSKSATNTALLMVFDGIVTISDNGKTYDTSNTNMADGKLSAVESTLGCLVWSSANSYDKVPDVVSSKQCFKSATIQGVNRDQSASDVEYIYVDDAGNAYHYFVKYVFPPKGSGAKTYYNSYSGSGSFTVTINCSDGGTVNTTTITGRSYGSALTVSGNTLKSGSTTLATATPNTGYKTQWKNVPNIVTRDVTIDLTFSPPPTITINCGEGGTVDKTTITGLADNAKLTVDGNTLKANGSTIATATPNTNYLTQWKNVPDTLTQDITINLTFKPPVTVTINKGEGGSVDRTSIPVVYNSKLTVDGNNLKVGSTAIATATPNTNYLTQWNNVPTTALTSDVTVDLTFIPPVTVTINKGEGGSVDRTSIPVVYNSKLTADGNSLKVGSTVIATATPDSGYCTLWGNVPNTALTSNTTIDLTFIPPVTVKFVPGDGVAAINDMTYNGTALTLPAPTKTGYTFDGWSLTDGGTNYVSEPYAPASDVTLYAHWTINTHTITLSLSNATGSVTYNGTTINANNKTITDVPYGATVTVTLTDFSQTDSQTLKFGQTSLGNKAGTYTCTMPDEDVTVTMSSTKPSTCLVAGTLITLADGTQKRVADLRGDEELLVWNLETGTYDKAPIVFIDSDSAAVYTVMHVVFSDGTDVEVVSEHGFFDLDLGEYVYINEDTIEDYIGDRFVKEADVENNTWDIVTLTDIWTENVRTEVYSPVTFSHLCYFTNGMLSIPGGVSGIFNIFDVDVELMMYDPAKKEADLERYGELTLEDYDGMIPEAAYDAFNGAWLNVAIEKGMLTWEDIERLAERYVPLL